MTSEGILKDTNREIYRRPSADSSDPDGYYQPKVYVTKEGALGISCAGSAYVRPLETWHRYAKEYSVLTQRISKLEAEIESLRSEDNTDHSLEKRVDALIADKIKQARRHGFRLARERISDPKHAGAMTTSGPVTKLRYEDFDDYERDLEKEGKK